MKISTKVTHDYMIIVESLREDEYHTGKNLYDILGGDEGIQLPGRDDSLPLKYVFVETSQAFKDLLKTLSVCRHLKSPLLHIEAHGGFKNSILDSSIKFANGEVVCCSEFMDDFINLNLASNFNLAVSFALCYGIGQMGSWGHALQQGKPCPFIAINGPTRSIAADNLLDTYIKFYKLFFKNPDISTVQATLRKDNLDIAFLDVKSAIYQCVKEIINQTAGTFKHKRAQLIKEELLKKQSTGGLDIGLMPKLTEFINDEISVNPRMEAAIEKLISDTLAFHDFPQNKERFSDLNFKDIIYNLFEPTTEHLKNLKNKALSGEKSTITG